MSAGSLPGWIVRDMLKAWIVRMETVPTARDMEKTLADFDSRIPEQARQGLVQADDIWRWLTSKRIPWTMPESYEAALSVARQVEGHYTLTAAMREKILATGAWNEVPAVRARMVDIQTQRLAELAHATATDTAQAAETLAEVVHDLNDDVASLTDVVTFVSDRVDMSAQERAEVAAALNNIRANRNAARATILGVLTELRVIIDRAENGILPGATSPSGGGRGGVLILAAGAAAAWLAFKG